MSMFGGAAAGGGIGGMRFAQSRNRMGNTAAGGVSYPSPFFDVAHTWLPVTVKQLFRWCRYYFLTNPLINAVVTKLSEYPITDLVIEHDDPRVVAKWKEFLYDGLNIRTFQLETGLDYNVFGNSYVSLNFPFWKMLSCRACRFEDRATSLRPHWRFVSNEFRLECPRCGHTGDADVRDQYRKSPTELRLMRWSPENIDVSFSEMTGKSSYYYSVPRAVSNDITIGRRDVLEETPQIFVQALKEQKSIIFSPGRLFHFKRPNLAESADRGIGMPLLLPVLKDTFYLQVMKKAQEAILLESIVPFRALFPQPGSGASDPFTSVNLSTWRDHVQNEILRWRLDPNYIAIMPLPLGHQTIGGDGKALLLTGEIQQWSDQILVGMGVPRELIFGGVSWSGTNVSLRMLENMFLRYKDRQLDMLRWIIREVAAFMEWPLVKVRFKPFKMADDIQRKSFNLELAKEGLLDYGTVLEDADYEPEEIAAKLQRELPLRQKIKRDQALGDATIQGEVSVLMARYQGKAQQEAQIALQAPPAPGEPGGAEGQVAGGSPGGQGGSNGGAPLPGGGGQPGGILGAAASPLQAGQAGTVGLDLPTMAQAQAQILVGMDPQAQQGIINQLRAVSPDLAQLVLKALGKLIADAAQAAAAGGGAAAAPAQAPTGGGGGGSPGGAPGVDMRPLPEQRPPRRENSPV